MTTATVIEIVNTAPSLPRPVVRFSHAIWSRPTQSSAVLEDIWSRPAKKKPVLLQIHMIVKALVRYVPLLKTRGHGKLRPSR